MTPLDFLQAADALMRRPPQSMHDCWPRCCAGLTRVALEQGIEAYYRSVAPTLAGRVRRHQFIALPYFTDPGVAQEASAVWHALSRALHHHAYELAPTLAELRDWHASVARLLRQLGGPIMTAAATT